ncbi:unnamed protein product [Closterium sp. NIES-54]
MLVCLSMFSPAFAGRLRLARTLQAHLHQRQLRGRERKLIHVADRRDSHPSRIAETKTISDNRRKQGLEDPIPAPIAYNNGPVMSGPTLNIYIIYYGAWTPKKSGQPIIENFITALSLSGADSQGVAGDPKVAYWWATNSKYYSQADDGSINGTVSQEVRFVKATTDKGSVGKKWKTATVFNAVKTKIGPKKPFPYDPYGIYLILPSKDIKIEGFCVDYCGWHSLNYIKLNNTFKPVVYAIVGHHAQCPDKCAVHHYSPNGNPPIDAMVSSIAHEVAEAASDPDTTTGWFDVDVQENADKCAYKFGDYLITQDAKGNDFKYNLVGLNGKKYMVQQNWDLDTGTCVMQTIPRSTTGGDTGGTTGGTTGP